MNDMINITHEEHRFSADDKLKWWGYGEWVEEPDLVEFTYLGLECRIQRTAVVEPYSKEFHTFGGHLCGYVRIPSYHSYLHKLYEDMDIICHGGLTFGEVSNGHWIGFDCGHSGDIIPSTEYLKKTNPNFTTLHKLFPLPEGFENIPWFNPTYRNVEYCTEQCMDIVNQLIETAAEKDK